MIKRIKEFATIETQLNDDHKDKPNERKVGLFCKSELEIDIELPEKALKDISNGIVWQFDETRGGKKFKIRIGKEGI